MVSCKNCNEQEIVKNGRVRGIQRYKCKACGLNLSKETSASNVKRR